jgi:hypothetical protein
VANDEKYESRTMAELYTEVLELWKRVYRLESEVRMLRARRRYYVTHAELRTMIDWKNKVQK